MKNRFNQNGVIQTLPLFFIITAVGIISFLLIVSTAPFKGNFFSRLFGKPFSHASIAIAVGDWPQSGHDPQKTSATPQSVNGPYRYYWRWTKSPLSSRVQEVVFNNVLYIGGLDGNFYALNASGDNQGSQPTTVWQKTLNTYDPNLNLGNITTGDPVRAGAGVDTSNNTIIVGTQHGTIYGLDTTTGNTKWTVFTGGAILASPVLDENGTAYLGSSDGYFYSINTSTGTVNWKTLVTDQNNRPAPILASAALSTDGTEVFFVAENVKAYSLNTLNGQIIWQNQMTGQGSADRWPVVLNNEVVFVTQPLFVQLDTLGEGDCILFGGSVTTCPPDRTFAATIDPSLWQSDWESVKPSILSYLNQKPDKQSYHIFDTATGVSKGILPVLFNYGQDQPMGNPAVYNNNYYLRFRPRHGIQNDGGLNGGRSVHVSTKYDDEIGALDPISLDISNITTRNAFRGEYRTTSDEPAAVTMAGDMLLIDSWERLGGMQLNTPTSSANFVGITQTLNHNIVSPCADSGGTFELMPFYETCPLNTVPAPDESGQERTGAVVAAGRIFWRPYVGGLGAIGPANNITDPPAPLAASAPSSSVGPYPTPISNPTTLKLQSYVWNSPTQTPPVSVPADLVQKLSQEIQFIINTNQHLMPYFTKGTDSWGSYPPDTTNPPEPAHQQNSRVFWFDPGELLYSLSLAYPYLPPNQQAQLLTYMKAEMLKFPPLQNIPWGTTPGAARESYPIPDAVRNSSTFPPPAVPLQTLYALWVYAKNTGDWTYIQNNWTTIQSLFVSKTMSVSSATVSNNAIDSYAEIAGAIGYARMAKNFSTTPGDSFDQQAQAGQNAAVAAMQTGLNFTNWLNIANTMYVNTTEPAYQITQFPGLRGPVFFGLVPEVGQYLKDTNKTAVDYVLNYSTGYNLYEIPIGSPNNLQGGCHLWYVTRLEQQCAQNEKSYESPEIGWSTFMTKAFVDGLSQQQLRFFLDRPWGLGDPWYLQKLVATIQAPSNGPTPAPSITTSPTPQPVTPAPTAFVGNKALQFLTNQANVTNSNEAVDFGKTVPGLGNTFTVESNVFYTGDMGDQFGNKYDIILSREDFGCEDWVMSIDADKAEIDISHDGLHASANSVTVTAPNVLTQNSWHHIAMSGDGTTLRLYIDGVMVSSKPQGGAVFDSSTQTNSCDSNVPYPIPVTMGRRAHPFNNGSFHGIIDEARISNIARYTGANFPVPTTPFSNDANTVALWHLDEGQGTSTADSSGHNLIGTINKDTITAGPVWVLGYPFSNSNTASVCQGADIDKNGEVNLFDYNILVTNFGKRGTGIPGDIDGNGIVNLFDYNILVSNFGKTGC